MTTHPQTWRTIARPLVGKRALHIDDEGTGPFAWVAPCVGEVRGSLRPTWEASEQGKKRLRSSGCWPMRPTRLTR